MHVEFKKTQQHQPAGKYQKTEHDLHKERAPFLLVSIVYGYRVKIQSEEVRQFIDGKINSRSIKKWNDDKSAANLTEKAFMKLAAQFPEYATDF